jgi:5-methylcytosine-specific restriction endonuclease McrA
MSGSWSGGSTRRWRRIRAYVLARDQDLCQIKITGTCTTAAEHVHHVLGRRLTGDDPQWLVAACEACNLLIGDPTDRPNDPPHRRMTQW